MKILKTIRCLSADMSKHLVTLVVTAMLVGGLAACSDDEDNSGEMGGGNVDGEVVEQPAEDILTTYITYPVAVFESGYDEVSERLLARMDMKTAVVGQNTMVVMLNAADNFEITDERWQDMKDVYDRDGVVLVVNPSEDMTAWLEKSMRYGNAGNDPDGDGIPDWDGEPGTERTSDMYAFTKRGDCLTLDDIYKTEPHDIVCKDSLGVEHTVTVVDSMPTQYKFGSFAESVAKWINTVLDAEARAKKDLEARTRAGEASDYFVSGVFETYVTNKKVGIRGFKKNWDKEYNINDETIVDVPITIMTYVSSAYNFEDKCDYYYIEMTEEMSAKNLWEGLHRHKPYSPINGWSQAGHAVGDVTVSVLTYHLDCNLRSDPVILKYSPQTDEHSKTVTTTTGWNFGGSGSFGLGRSDKWSGTGSLGLSFTHVDTKAFAETIHDISVAYIAKQTDKGPQWKYTIPRFSLSGAFVGKVSNVIGNSVGEGSGGKELLRTSQMFVWKIPGGRVYGSIPIWFTLSYGVMTYGKRKLYGHSSNMADQSLWGSYYKVTLPPPGRYINNYALVPRKIHDNAEWIQIQAILDGVSSYKKLREFTKCSVTEYTGDVDNAANEFYGEHYNELVNNCKRITAIKNTYELVLMNMTTGCEVSDRVIEIKPE